jgi:hypothetical protein
MMAEFSIIFEKTPHVAAQTDHSSSAPGEIPVSEFHSIEIIEAQSLDEAWTLALQQYPDANRHFSPLQIADIQPGVVTEAEAKARYPEYPPKIRSIEPSPLDAMATPVDPKEYSTTPIPYPPTPQAQ